jgi:hypothetical protein
VAGKAFDGELTGDAFGWTPARGANMGHIVAATMTTGLIEHKLQGCGRPRPGPGSLSL